MHPLIAEIKKKLIFHQKKAPLLIALVLLSFLVVDFTAPYTDEPAISISTSNSYNYQNVVRNHDLLVLSGLPGWQIINTSNGKVVSKYFVSPFENLVFNTVISASGDMIIFTGGPNYSNVGNSTLMLYNVLKNQVVTNKTFESPITAEFSQTGQFIIVRSTNQIQVYRIPNFAMIFENNYTQLFYTSFSTNDVFFSVRDSSHIFIYNTSSWSMIRELNLNSVEYYSYQTLLWLPTTTDYTILTDFQVSRQNTWYVLDTHNWSTILTINTGEQLQLSPNSKYAVVTNQLDLTFGTRPASGGYTIYNTSTWQVIKENNSVVVLSASFSDDGNYYAMFEMMRDSTLPTDRVLELFNAETSSITEIKPLDKFDQMFCNSNNILNQLACPETINEGTVKISPHGDYISWFTSTAQLIKDSSSGYSSRNEVQKEIVFEVKTNHIIFEDGNSYESFFTCDGKLLINRKIESNNVDVLRLSDGQIIHTYGFSSSTCCNVRTIYTQSDLFVITKDNMIKIWHDITNVSILQQITLYDFWIEIFLGLCALVSAIVIYKKK